jgi:uncharacterized protein YjiS (DUF1127 family)
MKQAQPPQLRPPRSHDSPGSIARRALAAMRRAWTCYWTRRAACATAGILHRLDDRGLKDIGLARSEIESAVHGDCQRRGRRSRERRAWTG